MAQYGVAFTAQITLYDTVAGTYKTGDAANIILYWCKDGTNSLVTSNSGVPTEVSSTNSPGLYKITISATEATCTVGKLHGKSTTATTLLVSGGEYHFDSYTTVLPVGAIPALGIMDNGPVQAATGTTLQLRSAVNLGADSNPIAMTVGIFSGTGYGQARAFTAYTNSTDTGTVDAWTTTPAANDQYVLYATAPGSLTNPPPVKVVASSGSYGVKANTALANFSFFMTDSTNHLPLTGATVTVQRSIDGGAFANATNTPATEIASGAYKITLAAGDLNGSTNVMLKCTATGADQRMIEFILSV